MARPPRLPLAAVALTSTCALAYEVLLTRVLSVLHWHHFAAVIISLALLGYGVSGSFLALARRRLQAAGDRALAGLSLGFALALALSVALLPQVPFNGLALFYEPGQLLGLLALALLVFLPFFFAAGVVGLALIQAAAASHRVYLADLLGAGVGAALATGLLFWLPPRASVDLVVALAFGAAALALRPGRRWWLALLPAAAFALLAFLRPPTLATSPYKDLAQTLQITGAQVVAQRTSPVGVTTVVDSPQVPFRQLPGRSLVGFSELPPQLALFTDGEGPTLVSRWDGDPGSLAYLDEVPAALPYHLVDAPRVAVLGAGGGSEVLQALGHDARQVDAVELNGELVALLQGPYTEFSGQLYQHPAVELHVDEARSFLARQDLGHYDIVQIALLDAMASTGAGALDSSTLYTVEALQVMLDRLRPGGFLVITRWSQLPPRDSLKLFATALDVQAARGQPQPADTLALLRSWNTTTLVVKNGPLSAEERALTRQFCEQRSFDLAWLSDLRPDEVNRYNLLPQPYLYEGARALADPASRGEFLGRYKFDLRPATDDRPYFHHTHKWRLWPELWQQGPQAIPLLVEAGYLIALLTLGLVTLLGAVGVLLPLRLARTTRHLTTSRRSAAYFALLGLAFLFLEMVFIHRSVLLVGHPVYAVSVVITAFLVFAGLGSGLSRRLSRALEPRDPLPWVVGALLLFSGIELALLPALQSSILALPFLARLGSVVLLAAPVALFMGMPFPLGLARVRARGEGEVAWAWAVNGFASVLSPLLATLLTVHLGFRAVALLAGLLYLLAAVVGRGLRRTPESRPAKGS